MIGYLQGTLLQKEGGKALILTASWVGYEVWVNESFLAPNTLLWEEGGTELHLYIHHYRTENSEMLFGFEMFEEKLLFEELIKINGVWWKVALNILSLGVENLVQAIKNSDNTALEQVKGIGKKGASKIVLELKDSSYIKQYQYITPSVSSWKQNARVEDSLFSQVKTTLMNMWYQAQDIEKTLEKAPEYYTSLDEILPFVIRNM